MKKTVLIVISIIILVALVIGTMYIIDRNRMKNNQPVVFSTWGYSYAPPVNINSEENNQNEQANNPNYSFFATVIESNEKNIIVEPVEGSRELKSTDKISIGLGENNDAIYPVGTTVKVTYDGVIMETYPAKINASKIEIKSTDNFELIFNERKDLGIKTIISATETDKYSYNICSYGGDIAIKIDNTEYDLRDALLDNKITMEEIIAKANQDAFQDKTIEVDSCNDGGTNIYHYNNYTIIKFHTVEGNRDVYIGTTYMKIDDVK